MNARTRPDSPVDTAVTRPLHLGAELLDVRPNPGRRWVSTFLGALGLLILAVLVAAIVTVSHETAHPAAPTRTTAPAPVSTVAVHTIAPAPPPAPRPTTSWSVAATASTLAAPSPPAAQPREPSVRQRLHDMFPRLIPGH